MSWAELLGQTHAVRFLRDVLARDRLAHAYLFEGPRGVGKNLAARLFAQAILCPEQHDGTPCGSCSSCRRVRSGQHPDLLFPEFPVKKDGRVVDWVALSEDQREIPVDTVRRLREQIALKPLESPRQVTIIADADRMNTEAENALLKTLEEPPEHAVLILTTSRPEDLLPTTRSRCVRVRFGTLSPADINGVLRERYGLSASDADALARHGAGSLGRAVEARGDVVRQLREFAEKAFGALPERKHLAQLTREAEQLIAAHAAEHRDAAQMTDAALRRVEALRLLEVMGLMLRESMLLALAGGAGMLLEETRPTGALEPPALLERYQAAFAHIARAERAVRQNVRVGLVFHVLFVRLRQALVES